MSARDQAIIYQRIGEFVVSFQWIENRIRDIGWLILDPDRKTWPPRELRDEPLSILFRKVQSLFLDCLPRCELGPDLEQDFRDSFAHYANRFHKLRAVRNRIMHSAYIEMKAGGEVVALMRADPRMKEDPESGKMLFDREVLSKRSFDTHMEEMGHLAMFFNRCYTQLLHRLPHV